MYEKNERKKGVIFFLQFYTTKIRGKFWNPVVFTYSIVADSFWMEESRIADRWLAMPESTWTWRSRTSARRWWSTGEIRIGLLGPVVARLCVLKSLSSISSEYSVIEAMRDLGASFWNIILIIISILLKRIFFCILFATTRILRNSFCVYTLPHFWYIFFVVQSQNFCLQHRRSFW